METRLTEKKAIKFSFFTCDNIIMKIMRKKQEKTWNELIPGTNKQLITVSLPKRQKVIT